MSELASAEVGTSAENLAEVLDWQLLNIAYHLPNEIKRAASGTETTLYSLPGVGQLKAVYLGHFKVRVKAVTEGYEGRLGFWKDYELDYHQNPIELTVTSPDELTDCPAPLPMLANTVQLLHDGYIQIIETQLAQDNTVSITQRMRDAGLLQQAIVC